MISKNQRNFKIFIISSLILAFFGGLMGPLYVLFINKFTNNNITYVGIGFGFFGIAFATISYFAGKYSDKFGRKIFMITSGILHGLLLIIYTFIIKIYQLYIVQFLDGMVSAAYATTATALLADLTKKEDRGKKIGKYNSIVGIFSSIALIFSGILVSKYGFKFIFYIVALGLFTATLLLFKIKE